jgi:probable HAF family extracellular repeat protein
MSCTRKWFQALAAGVALYTGFLSIRAAHAVAPAPRYVLTDIGSLYGTDADARGINNNGVIVGISYKPNIGSRAFRTGPTLPINPSTDDLGAIGNFESAAFGVNSSGQSVGWVATATGASQVVAARYPATGTDVASSSTIGSFGGTVAIALDINDAGQAVGYARRSGQTNDHAFRTGPNQSINASTDDLGTLGGTTSNAYGINNSGQVAGYSAVNSSITHAFRTRPNLPINPVTDDLGTLGGPHSLAYDINDAGWVVGYSNVATLEERAFLCPPGRPINPLTDNLGTIPGFGVSFANAVNNSQVVVGYAVANQTFNAFVYDGTAMYNLNDLVEPTSRTGWVLSEAFDVNDRGQIVGNGYLNGQFRSFLLTPIPEPSAACLLVMALVTAPWFQRRRRRYRCFDAHSER